ncbi:hypothetical protein [Nonomuraea endophytica]|uniref:Uncharacterized protein n=1 Tax=Nonomuraea endophytica TaxID=714136 RepID=A0A7W7ZWY3_9ACTN|nr:hypothetical protein [Nonomuraea endophytica]MBB5075299.1 hypothetical protein [Nonomuraea endophytica]
MRRTGSSTASSYFPALLALLLRDIPNGTSSPKIATAAAQVRSRFRERVWSA